MNIICFHNPNEENGYLSNWYLSDFSVDGIEFTSMEQFMMYRKAICFGNEAIAKEILASKDVAYVVLHYFQAFSQARCRSPHSSPF